VGGRCAADERAVSRRGIRALSGSVSISVGLARGSSRTNSGQKRVDVTVFQNIGNRALALGMGRQFR
jgi:hypothetical protein